MAVGVNTELTKKLNWNAGNCINREILGCSRAEYGNNGICHDRFLIIDDKERYMIGASLKDLGKKCLGFTKMDAGEIDHIKGSAFASGERTGASCIVLKRTTNTIFPVWSSFLAIPVFLFAAYYTKSPHQ